MYIKFESFKLQIEQIDETTAYPRLVISYCSMISLLSNQTIGRGWQTVVVAQSWNKGMQLLTHCTDKWNQTHFYHWTVLQYDSVVAMLKANKLI